VAFTAAERLWQPGLCAEALPLASRLSELTLERVGQRLNEQLSGALTSRVVIEQAKGVIAERAGVDLAEAFSRLRAYARSRNLRLTDVAQAAIDGTLDPLA
jgi:AmiR/NasT family two-component response regulator